jgi:hypothetical protein
MASKGRGSDSMLVHMTPEEVQSLQVLALKGGGTLTVNPDTGLPEANFLKKLLPMIAGAALNFFAPGLGTAVGGMFGLGAAAGTGIAVGGISALATGSLSRGLMAGLGAYGGASLAGGLANAGTGAMAAGDIAAQQAAGAFPTLAEGATQAQVADYASQVGALRDTALSKAGEAGLGAKLSAGMGQMASNPGMYGKELLTGLATVAPMMADEGVQTTTKRPDTGTIRNFTFDPYGQTYTNVGNYPASEYKGMAQGGIVALADGGTSKTYFEANPDVAAAYANRAKDPNLASTVNMTADQFAQTHYDKFGKAEGRTWGAPATAPATTPQTNAPEGTTNPYGNPTNPGDQTFNPDNSITVQPNIPGRPYGGFSGMDEVKNAYTQGGGSLGYVNPAPQNMDEFNTRFNKQTGDSLAAYNYLMGQGANPATQQRVGEIMRPYREAIIGIPAAEGRPTQKYIYQNGKYIENPNYVPVSYNSKGERITGLSNTDVISGFDALKPAETQANFDYDTYLKTVPGVQAELDAGVANFGTKADPAAAAYNHYLRYGKNEGQKFPLLSTAKPEDQTIFEWANTNNVSDAQLAARMGISVAEVARRRKKKTNAGSIFGGYGDGGGGDSGGSDAGGDASGVGDSGSGASGSGDGSGGNGSAGDFARGGAARRMALGGLGALAGGGATSQYNLGGYSDGGRLLRGPGDGVSDSIPATIGDKQPARLADGEFVVPARIVSELGNGSTEAGARRLYAMMDRVQKARGKTTGKNRVAANTRSEKYLPA